MVCQLYANDVVLQADGHKFHSAVGCRRRMNVGLGIDRCRIQRIIDDNGFLGERHGRDQKCTKYSRYTDQVCSRQYHGQPLSKLDIVSPDGHGAELVYTLSVAVLVTGVIPDVTPAVYIHDVEIHDKAPVLVIKTLVEPDIETVVIGKAFGNCPIAKNCRWESEYYSLKRCCQLAPIYRLPPWYLLHN